MTATKAVLQELAARWEAERDRLTLVVEASPSEAWYETGQALAYGECARELREHIALLKES